MCSSAWAVRKNPTKRSETGIEPGSRDPESNVLDRLACRKNKDKNRERQETGVSFKKTWEGSGHTNSVLCVDLGSMLHEEILSQSLWIVCARGKRGVGYLGHSLFFFCFSQIRQPHTRDQRPKKKKLSCSVSEPDTRGLEIKKKHTEHERNAKR